MKVNRCEGAGTIIEAAVVKNKMELTASKIASLIKDVSPVDAIGALVVAYQLDNGQKLNPEELTASLDEWASAIKIAFLPVPEKATTIEGMVLERAVNLIGQRAKQLRAVTQHLVDEAIVSAYTEVQGQFPNARITVPDTARRQALVRQVLDIYNAQREQGDAPVQTPQWAQTPEAAPPPAPPAGSKAPAPAGAKIPVPGMAAYQSADGKVTVKIGSES